jgi:D-glycero-D-manno-heptose 1,7-bisphosphate phosphatase
MNRALFLDRDGVINVNHGYVHKPQDFEFIDGIFDVCRLAIQKGYLLIVVTNQAGIGRGYYSEETFHALTTWMCDQFKSHDITISKVYWCPDHPEHGIGIYKRESPNRKPAPGMILTAAQEFNIDLESSVLVGDSESDIQAGLAAGVGKNILFSSDSTKNNYKKNELVIFKIKKLEFWLI